jgi:hypothetical protein
MMNSGEELTNPKHAAEDPLPKTAKMLARACDVRLPLLWEDEDFVAMENVIVESLEAALQVK